MKAGLDHALGTLLYQPDLPGLRGTTDAERALDGGAIEAMAGNMLSGGPGMTVVRSSQPFGEIANALEGLGFERRGRALERPGSPRRQGDFTVVGDAGDGLVVLGYALELVEESIDGYPGADSESVELIQKVDGVGQEARPDDSECIEGFAIGIDENRAEVVIVIDGKAEPDRLNLEEQDLYEFTVEPFFVFGPPRADDDTLRFEVRPKRKNRRAPWLQIFSEDRAAYDC